MTVSIVAKTTSPKGTVFYRKMDEHNFFAFSTCVCACPCLSVCMRACACKVIDLQLTYLKCLFELYNINIEKY